METQTHNLPRSCLEWDHDTGIPLVTARMSNHKGHLKFRYPRRALSEKIDGISFATLFKVSSELLSMRLTAKDVGQHRNIPNSIAPTCSTKYSENSETLRILLWRATGRMGKNSAEIIFIGIISNVLPLLVRLDDDALRRFLIFISFEKSSIMLSGAFSHLECFRFLL